jgi:uncharacterized coiled-coil protein SlyX
MSMVKEVSAMQKVDDKLAVLSDWLKNGIPWKRRPDGEFERDSLGELIPFDFPKNIYQFCEWAGEIAWSGEPVHNRRLHATPRSTLNQPTYDTKRAEVTKTYSRLSEKVALQLERANKSSIIERLNTTIIQKQKIIDQQEIDVIHLRRFADIANKSLEEEKGLRSRNEAVFVSRIQELEAQVASLKTTLATVTPLRRAK